MPEIAEWGEATTRSEAVIRSYSFDKSGDMRGKSIEQSRARATKLLLQSMVKLHGDVLRRAVDRVVPLAKTSELTIHENDFIAPSLNHRLPPVSEDKNIEAYKRELPRLLRDHESQFVAFAKGKLIDINASRNELRKLAHSLHPGESILIAKIQRKPRRSRLLSPNAETSSERRPDATQDEDLQAFQEMLPELLKEHRGEYALIIHRGLIRTDPDELALLEYAYAEYPDDDGLIQPIQETLPIFDMGGAAALAE